MLNIIALSGGKDSTAMALRLAELNPDIDYTYMITPTGDELPEMIEHWEKLECILGKKLVKPSCKYTLNSLIEEFGALPNWRQRWCTRMLKIEPAMAYYAANPGSTVYVGLRADEESRKGGIYGNLVNQKYPLREWNWGLSDVVDYLNSKGIKIPKRTDCARCYEQRIGEWWNLWKNYNEIYKSALDQESKTGYTFRSATKDSWPASLHDLSVKFEAGYIPIRADVQHDLFNDDEEELRCRACSL